MYRPTIEHIYLKTVMISLRRYFCILIEVNIFSVYTMFFNVNIKYNGYGLAFICCTSIHCMKPAYCYGYYMPHHSCSCLLDLHYSFSI